MPDTIVEILIDNSGSMGYMKGSKEHENMYLIDGLTRMSLVKKLLVEEIIPTVDYASAIVIRTFRKSIKNLAGAEYDEVEIPVLYQGNYDFPKIYEKVNSLPDPSLGGTPITEAINAAIANLGAHPNSDRKIILLTDGEENGGGNYKEAARRALELEGIPCKIFVIGINQDAAAESASKSFSTGGYLNIKSKNFSSDEVEKALIPLKMNVLQNTLTNMKSESIFNGSPSPHQGKVEEVVENRLEKLLKENTVANFQQLESLESKVLEQITSTQKLLSELSTIKESLRISSLLDIGIDSTTLTIDQEYSESVRQRSETFLYKVLCDKYGQGRINWVNRFAESFKHYDFELLDEQGEVIQFIECKGTARQKPTFYLTKDEWVYFLEHKDCYQLYRVFNVDGEMNFVATENLFTSLVEGKVVPYLLKPEILKEGRVFLTLMMNI